MISTDNISTIPYLIVESMRQIDNIFEMRLMGWVLAKAQSVIKLYNADLKDINLSHALNLVRVTMPARYLLPEGDNNYKHIRKAFNLAKRTIPYERDGVEYQLNIIAMPELRKRGHQTEISFVIHNLFWYAAVEFSRGYRLVNLPAMLRLHSTYSVMMYLLVSECKKPTAYAIPTLRAALGATAASYDKTFNFERKVLQAAKKELDASAPWTYDYRLEARSKGKTYTHVVIEPRRSDQPKPPDTEKDRDLFAQRLRLDERVTDYMRHSLGMEVKDIERVEGYLMRLGDWQRQLDKLATIRDYAAARKVRNLTAYITASVQRALP